MLKIPLKIQVFRFISFSWKVNTNMVLYSSRIVNQSLLSTMGIMVPKNGCGVSLAPQVDSVCSTKKMASASWIFL